MYICVYVCVNVYVYPEGKIMKISSICGRQGRYARPRGVVVARSFPDRVFLWPPGRRVAIHADGSGDREGARVVTNGKQHNMPRFSACPPHKTTICICTYIPTINYMYLMWRIKYLILIWFDLICVFKQTHWSMIIKVSWIMTGTDSFEERVFKYEYYYNGLLDLYC